VPEHRRRFSPEFREEAVRLVVDSNRPIAEIARELGMHDGTLGNWVANYRRVHAGDEPELSVNERARLRELERLNQELRMENEFLKKAAAYFAQDRR
jgi:transposase